jgi:hypothetical protein
MLQRHQSRRGFQTRASAVLFGLSVRRPVDAQHRRGICRSGYSGGEPGDALKSTAPPPSAEGYTCRNHSARSLQRTCPRRHRMKNSIKDLHQRRLSGSQKLLPDISEFEDSASRGIAAGLELSQDQLSRLFLHVIREGVPCRVGPLLAGRVDHQLCRGAVAIGGI